MLFFCLFVSFPPVSLVCSFDSVGVLFFFKAMLLFQFRFFSFFGAFSRIFLDFLFFLLNRRLRTRRNFEIRIARKCFSFSKLFKSFRQNLRGVVQTLCFTDRNRCVFRKRRN